MAKWTAQTLSLALSLFFQCNSSYKAFESKWKEANSYQHTPIPSRKYMSRLVIRFRKTGSIHKVKPPGRPKSVRVETNIYAVAQHLVEKPTDSVKNCKDELDISRTSIRRILRQDLKYKPYRPRIVHMLKPVDYNRRFWFCDRMLKLLDQNIELLNNFLFMDEVYVKLNGHMCTRNLVFWDNVNPNMIVERTLNGHGIMFLVCCSVRGALVYAFDSVEIPEIFEKDRSKKRRVFHSMPSNAKTFLYVFKEKMLSDLKIMFPDINLSDIIVCLDGCRTHTEAKVTEFLNKTFNFWIGNNSPVVQWPRFVLIVFMVFCFLFKISHSHSPDLMCLDFAVFHPLRCKVFRTPPTTLMQLKERFIHEVNSLDLRFLLKIITQGFPNRLIECKMNNGKHIEIWRS